MRTTLYKLVILHDNDSTWADELTRCVKTAVKEIIQRDNAVICQYSVPDEQHQDPEPIVVVYLASPDAARNGNIISELEKAKAQAFGILPLRRSGQDISQVIPDAIRRLNAMTWDGAESRAALRILELFGVVERKRKLFLSYRQEETSELALQLRRALSERCFDVFLDRFSVPPGDDFQRRLDIELADKAFVLLIESQSAVDSPWVQHEVSYALSHNISVLALTLPSTPSSSLFEVVDEAFRYRLSNSDFQPSCQELSRSALDLVLDQVELRCARQVRRRRSQLLGSLNDWLFQAGFQSYLLDDWAILAERSGQFPTVYMVTPRGPTAWDLHTVDLLRLQVVGADTAKIRGCVVHSTMDQDPDNERLVKWVLGGRSLETRALDELPVLWGL